MIHAYESQEESISYDQKNATLEERVAELEAICEKQGKQIRTLVAVFRTVNLSAFDSPLKRFFDGPQILDFFFDVEERLECSERCAEIYNQQIANAGDDEAAKTAAANAFSDCYLKCEGILP